MARSEESVSGPGCTINSPVVLRIPVVVKNCKTIMSCEVEDFVQGNVCKYHTCDTWIVRTFEIMFLYYLMKDVRLSLIEKNKI